MKIRVNEMIGMGHEHVKSIFIYYSKGVKQRIDLMSLLFFRI